MEYEMSVNDRLALLPLIPEVSNLLIIRLAKKFREQVGFTEEEQEELEMKIEGNTIKWNKDKEKTKKIVIDDATKEMLKKRVIELNEKGQIDISLFSVLEKFDLIPKEVM